FREFEQLMKIPGIRINLRRQIIVPVIMTFDFRQLHVKSILSKHITRRSYGREREKLIDRSHLNMNGNLARRPLDDRLVVMSERSGMNGRRGKIFGLKKRHIQSKRRSARVPKQVHA